LGGQGEGSVARRRLFTESRFNRDMSPDSVDRRGGGGGGGVVVGGDVVKPDATAHDVSVVSCRR